MTLVCQTPPSRWRTWSRRNMHKKRFRHQVSTSNTNITTSSAGPPSNTTTDAEAASNTITTSAAPSNTIKTSVAPASDTRSTSKRKRSYRDADDPDCWFPLAQKMWHLSRLPKPPLHNMSARPRASERKTARAHKVTFDFSSSPDKPLSSLQPNW